MIAASIRTGTRSGDSLARSHAARTGQVYFWMIDRRKGIALAAMARGGRIARDVFASDGRRRRRGCVKSTAWSALLPVILSCRRRSSSSAMRHKK